MYEKKLVKLLIEKGYKISFAESMTGGLLASSLIKVSNASKVIEASYVTYSDEEKCHILGIDENLIKQHGVVSKEVALAMIKGLHNLNKADILVSVTGSAGPTSYDGIKVGEVYIGIKIKDKEEVLYYQIKNFGRNYIRRSTRNKIFQYLLKNI